LRWISSLWRFPLALRFLARCPIAAILATIPFLACPSAVKAVICWSYSPLRRLRVDSNEVEVPFQRRFCRTCTLPSEYEQLPWGGNIGFAKFGMVGLPFHRRWSVSSPDVTDLILEDDLRDVELCIREMKKKGFELQLDAVDTEEGFAAKLQSRVYDLILADNSIPKWSAVQALSAPGVPSSWKNFRHIPSDARLKCFNKWLYIYLN
jgi:hypothetical protein